MLVNFGDGKLAVEELNAKLGIYKETAKRGNLLLKAHALNIVNESLTGGKVKEPKKLMDRTAKRGR